MPQEQEHPQEGVSAEQQAAYAASPTPRIVKLKNFELRRRIVALTIVPTVFFAAIVVAIPAAIFLGSAVTTIIPALLVTVIAELIVIIWALGYAGLLKQWASNLYLNKITWRGVLLGVLIGQLAYWGLQLIAWLISLTGSTVESSETSVSLGAVEGPARYLVLLFMVPVLVPFVEEVLFRGVVVGALQRSKWTAPWIAMLISGLSFGTMHIQGFSSLTDIAVIIWTGLMGAAFALTVIKTKSLWVVFIAHGVYNLSSALVMLSGIGS